MCPVWITKNFKLFFAFHYFLNFMLEGKIVLPMVVIEYYIFVILKTFT